MVKPNGEGLEVASIVVKAYGKGSMVEMIVERIIVKDEW